MILLLCIAHFSTTIGAVHNSNYTMFEVGAYANRGLSDLVLTGETFTLEQELANEVSTAMSNDDQFCRLDFDLTLSATS
jgi:hypothetical protein